MVIRRIPYRLRDDQNTPDLVFPIQVGPGSITWIHGGPSAPVRWLPEPDGLDLRVRGAAGRGEGGFDLELDSLIPTDPGLGGASEAEIERGGAAGRGGGPDQG